MLSLKSFISGTEALAYWSFEGFSPFEKMRILDPAADHNMVIEDLAAMVREFPELQGVQVAQSWGGMIDSTPDAIPVISEVNKLPGLILPAGYSGHGFGIGPEAGRLAADLAMNANPIVDPTPYRYARFIDGSGLDTPGMM